SWTSVARSNKTERASCNVDRDSSRRHAREAKSEIARPREGDRHHGVQSVATEVRQSERHSVLDVGGDLRVLAMPTGRLDRVPAGRRRAQEARCRELTDWSNVIR